MKREILEEIRASRNSEGPFVLITNLADGTQRIYREHEQWLDSDPILSAKCRIAIRHDQSVEIQSDGVRHFLQVFNPRPRLLLIGAVHIAQSLGKMAMIAGLDVLIIDPREAYVDSQRFPNIEVSKAWPDQALADAAIDRRCAIVTLAHDPKLDDAALSVAIRSDAFYIGSLGSKKTHSTRLRRLREAGFDENELARIRGPVGLSIGAATPAEISISILAEIIAALRITEC